MINIIVLEAVRVLGLTMVSFLVAFAITPLVIRLIEKMNFKKQIRTADKAPVFHNLHKAKEGTPTMGGIIIWSAVLIIALSIFILSYIFDGFWSYLNFVDRAQTYVPLFALAFAATIGLVDDIFGVRKIGPNGGGLTMKHRVLIYTGVAMLGALWFYFKLGWEVINIPFVGMVNLGPWYMLLFVFIIVASAFSANEADGLDGLAGGIMLFTYGALTVVAFVLGRFDLATLGGVIIGALLAFLWFNIYPARFFMGDTGSMSLGVTIGVIAMLTNTPLLLPLFAPIFVIESASVIIQLTSKKFRKKKVFLSAPIHHHFEALGWHETKVTMRFWIISIIFVGFGLVIFFLNQFL
ncbi:MAG: phospho-N-acetylmuramoyl-pentapeptide-transferase [Candidatus Harrisonbacteria bacterium CG10_big_fil_rev_8_21_14_0_10_38_8]|uniref:Phospho-N-acetylmuramoyl-pentapeptide-transferase n=1 Tax=Candidatus Harrisonbacteria bacterium CG10_big_fil_rev_8_21_14_0_10_38_8 TaxID=1974582 RepID=A0A2M6WJU8_9BACT|nr:MAG: phospho-N-acetylmuramoyl-pentapeptide-transferase [Candidatus Harrisonbacteria bacterium CG10_big_fil_rev_8_21_14_0_10_38_8]